MTRSTRSVSTTDVGERLAKSIGSHFDDIASGLADLGELRDKPAGSLRITSDEHASQTILLPALAHMLPDYPDISVEVFNDYGLADIVADRLDAGVRLGEQVAQDMIAVRIGGGLQAVCRRCADQFQTLRQAEDAARVDRASLHCVAFANVRGIWSWPVKKGAHEFKVRPGGELAFNTVTLQLDSAVAG